MAMLMYGLEMESMHLFQAKVEQREADIQDIEANLICYAGKNPRNLTEKKGNYDQFCKENTESNQV